MRIITFILTIIFVTITQMTLACDCDSQGEFLIVAPKSKLVALIKVTKYLTFANIYDKKIPMSMEVEIIEIFKGIETRKTVIVWGDDGIMCRPYLSQFDLGQYYVIAFGGGIDGTKGYGHKNEKPSDYSISICGDYWLKANIKSKMATGAISNKQTSIKLVDLKSKLNGK